MQAPKRTLTPGSSRTDVYFDADKLIEEYEQMTGEPVGENVKVIIHDFEGIINKAYQDGYRDGMEDTQ